MKKMLLALLVAASAIAAVRFFAAYHCLCGAQAFLKAFF